MSAPGLAARTPPVAGPAYAVHYDAPSGAWATSVRRELKAADVAWNEYLRRGELVGDGARVRVQYGRSTLYDWTRRGGHWTHTGEGAPTP